MDHDVLLVIGYFIAVLLSIGVACLGAERDNRQEDPRREWGIAKVVGLSLIVAVAGVLVTNLLANKIAPVATNASTTSEDTSTLGLRITELGWREVAGKPQYDKTIGLWHLTFGLNPAESAESLPNQRIAFVDIRPTTPESEPEFTRKMADDGKEMVWVVEACTYPNNTYNATDQKTFFVRANNRPPE